ncbi:hypothetical protein ES288_A07G204300v1 [Gossypium darwinii]|uniref:phosphoserine phosphatase n=1 Tax=Gossypium darwinii TaxID=34276 RepID=A0A5D2FYR3_GOSDA|nr:hypothetical protein ES288_A07G204300v1 [Gossypium darwinii]
MALKSSSLVIWISPGIEELVKKLKARNTDVYLIFGGFRQMINPVASILGISQENIFPISCSLEVPGSFWDSMLMSPLRGVEEKLLLFSK